MGLVNLILEYAAQNYSFFDSISMVTGKSFNKLNGYTLYKKLTLF